MKNPSDYIFAAAILVFWFFVPQSVSAQNKYESESRLQEELVPAKALYFIDSLQTGASIRWYLEQGLQSSSIEAKFTSKRQNHSVEFDTLGNIEDIEVEMKWSDLPPTLQDSISASLKGDCENYKVRKVQIQYSGSPSSLITKIKSGDLKEGCTVKYELVVKCNTFSDAVLYEFLFSDTGEQEGRSKIVFKNSSNLEY